MNSAIDYFSLQILYLALPSQKIVTSVNNFELKIAETFVDKFLE